ncbi:hypothetical protein CHREV_276 [Choristoneura rosaceana entomopoxvirus 'L']|uniref:Uncharacterized protein n=1 Tax=Choristoneura rosaceana entomopoxvirus 'L' TaxID=1293539 RepID=A0ABM9QKY0_9POXV|nr:hypothetical protein CHREV_276 [Choristoneura rosaceana entomopoxvirus 'L']CCU56178.1 hypothetical protein CHREV_276 [Choristoneura rosaceana entomopoxvirus 'L']
MYKITLFYILFLINNIKSNDEDPGFSYRFNKYNIEIKRPGFLDTVNFNNNINGINVSRHHIIPHNLLSKFYVSMTKTKIRQEALALILTKIKSIKGNNEDIDNLIKCLRDDDIDDYINCNNLLFRVYPFIFHMPFNIFIGPIPSNRYSDLGSFWLDVEGRALLPTDLIKIITDVHYIMMRIQENKLVLQDEINTLVGYLIKLLDHDLESEGFDDKLWIKVNRRIIENKSKSNKKLLKLQKNLEK